MGQNIVSQLEINVQQVTDVVLTKTWIAPTELQPCTLFTLGVMLDLIRHSMCDAMLGSGDARWEMQKLRAAPSNPLGAPTHQEPQHTSTSSWSLAPGAASAIWTQAGWQLYLMVCCAAIQWFGNGTALAEHQPLKGGSRLLGVFSHHGEQFPRTMPPSMVLAPQACSLACPCQEHRAIPSPFRWLLWMLGTQGFSTQQPLRSWDQRPGDAYKRFGLEQSCTLPWKDQHRWKWVND